jgi:receptor tyrosine kinase
MQSFLTPSFILIVSALGFIIIIISLLIILISQRFYKRHRGYNQTECQVIHHIYYQNKMIQIIF